MLHKSSWSVNLSDANELEVALEVSCVLRHFLACSDGARPNYDVFSVVG
jgi:hypothetical protein